MALAAVLSAIRTIILDVPDIPAGEQDRRVSYRVLFPELSVEEVEDLAKIPPQKLFIYTRSIFNGESDLIAHHHPFTCALVERAWQKHRRGEFKLRNLVRAVHAKHPWKTKWTEGLIESFGRYLADSASEFGDLRNQITEAAAFERHIFYARRCADAAAKGGVTVDRKRLASLTVGEVLSLGWYIPATTTFQTFTYDVPAAYAYFQSHQGRLPNLIAQRKAFLMFGRDGRHAARWREIPEQLFSYFSKESRGEGTLDAVAERFVQTLPPGLSEQESFVQFITFGVDLIEAGLVVVNKNIDEK